MMIQTLRANSKSEFYLRIHYWKIKHQSFLNERSEKPNDSSYFPYKYRHIRSAHTNIKRYMDYIFYI